MPTSRPPPHATRLATRVSAWQLESRLRELTAATELRKPLIVVYEPEDGHGGGNPKELLQGCPAALRTSLEQHSFIRWAIKPDLQLIALTLVCSRPLLYFEANLLAVAYRVAHVNSIS